MSIITYKAINQRLCITLDEIIIHPLQFLLRTETVNSYLFPSPIQKHILLMEPNLTLKS
jgi:hypothetical protein